MKKLLFLVPLLSYSLQAEIKTYRVESTIVGYECPDGYYYHTTTGDCYPKKQNSANEALSRVDIGNPSANSHAALKTPNITIYNYNGGGLKMPEMDIVGALPEKPVRRRKSLDKESIIKLLDGDFSKEEPKDIMEATDME